MNQGKPLSSARALRMAFGVLACGLFTCTALAVKPVVKVVPWVPSDPTIPHDTYAGKVITLKGTSDVQGANFRWTWDFGDGTSASAVVSDKYVVEARHAYNGPVDTLFTASLKIEDLTTGESTSKSYYVHLGPKELKTEVNVAIDEGLWYLHKAQTRWTSGTLELGDWASGKAGGYANASYTSLNAENLCAFEVQGHVETGSADNPYTETVQRAMRRLFQRLTYWNIGLKSTPFGTWNSDQNGNGIGIVVNDGLELYQGGMVIDAIIASGTPFAPTVTGGPNVVGRAYRDIVQDMVDAYIYAQYDGAGGGGWRYSVNQYPDNSACQWAAIGMIPAEREWGLAVPTKVKLWNAEWLKNSQYNSAGNFYHGAFGYQPGYWFPWGPYATTPSGMVQMAMDGIGRGGAGWPSWDAAETFIRNNFGNTGSATSSIRNYYYGLFSFVKSMLLHDSNGDGIPEPITILKSSTPGVLPIDWYAAEVAKGDPLDGVARTLVNGQTFSTYWGYWYGHEVDGRQYIFDTAWAIMMLNRTVFDPGVPVAVAKGIPNPGIVGQPIILDGSDSFHKAPGRQIISWEWDIDNDGTFEAVGPVTQALFADLGVYPVTLRVKDDSLPQKTAQTVLDLLITTPPVGPTADANGPYVFCPQAVPWFLDGRLSTNPDEGKHEPGPYPGDTLQSYEWDLNGDNVFGDVTGATPDVTSILASWGPGVYVVQLRVTDTTATSFPSSGMGDLSDVVRATVIVKEGTDPDCQCVTLTASVTGKQVALTWTALPGAAAYAVYRSMVSGGPYILIGYAAGTTYTDTTGVSGQKYFYVVRPTALNGNELCQSNQVEAQPRCPAPVCTWAPSTKISNVSTYYREIFGKSDCYDGAGLKMYIGDTATPGFVAGPYVSKSVLRIQKGTTAVAKPGFYGAAANITVKGQATLWAVDPLGETSVPVVIQTN